MRFAVRAAVAATSILASPLAAQTPSSAEPGKFTMSVEGDVTATHAGVARGCPGKEGGFSIMLVEGQPGGTPGAMTMLNLKGSNAAGTFEGRAALPMINYNDGKAPVDYFYQSGSVTLTKVAADQIAGTYDLAVFSPRARKKATLKGSFAAKTEGC